LSGGFKDVDITDAPPSQVTISGFLMDSAPVTGGQWSLIAEGYAQSHGYTFDNGGVVKSGSYPMQNVNWYDAVKWCNARSENEGASPVYFSDAAFSTVYRSGHTAPYIKPGANGYRLPTEAEWEIAARGGLSGVRFPLSNTVSQAQANYWSCNDTNKCGPLAYDLGPPGLRGTTTLVGSFPPNGYGLFDMAGNVSEWCWDWYDPNYYNTQITSDPQGPVSGTTCVWRGGSYADTASVLRCAYRGNLDPLQGQYYDIGFRCVRAF
jgi:sulfatase modifying factor 1